jgi:hypothetical protein
MLLLEESYCNASTMLAFDEIYIYDIQHEQLYFICRWRSINNWNTIIRNLLFHGTAIAYYELAIFSSVKSIQIARMEKP